MRRSAYLKYLILFLFIIFVVTNVIKFRFGYFESVGALNFDHPDADTFLLNNEKIMILGDSYNNIPSEIYDINNKTVNTYEFPENLNYTPEGILLGDNKLFLLRTCIEQNCGLSINYNLDENKIEHIYTNTFSIGNINLNNKLINYLLLNNNNIFYIAYKYNTNQSEIGIFDVNHNEKYSVIFNENLYNAKSIQINNEEVFIITINNAYIYNIKNHEINKLNFPYNKLANSNSRIQRVSHLVKLKDKIIIFVYLMNDKYKYYNLTLSFDLNTHKFSQLASSSILRDYDSINGNNISNIIKLNDDYILINGGVTNIGIIGALFGGHYIYNKSAEIYDIKKNRFYRITDMPYAKFGHRAIPISDNEIMLFGGVTKKVIGSLHDDQANTIILFKRF